VDFKDAFSLRGHRAVITGGGSGLGFATAECFVAAGAEVVIAGRNEARLKDAAARLGPAARGIAFDVTRVEAAGEFAAQVEREAGPVSILVNNAGITVKKPIAEMTVEDFLAVLNTHVVAAFALTRAFLPQLKESRRGSVLFTASMSTYLGVPFIIGYSAAKSAYGGMIRALATELAPQGVRVNGVAPGWIDTPMFRQATSADPARLSKIMGRIPMQRTGQTADVGWAMTYLAADAAAYVTGHILVVDGGAVYGF
jgi:gluconate 5-dehydrogenase